jgi:hypothetical protein
VQILEGQSTSADTLLRRDEAEAELRAEIEERKLDAFPLAVAAHDLRVAASTLVQAWGVGPIRANTVLLNWSESLRDWRSDSAALWYARLLASAIRLRQNVVVLAVDDAGWGRAADAASDKRRIDVWWWDDGSSKLCLLLAYLMTRTEEWDEATIRLLVPTPAGREGSVEKNLVYRLEERRIAASVEPVADADSCRVREISADAGAVFLPLRISGMRVIDPFGESIEALLAGLPMTALVAASDDVQLAEVEPQEDEAPAKPAGGDGE